MKVFIFSDTHWSLGRVHRGVMKQLPYEVRYTDWASYTADELFENYNWCDKMITNLVAYKVLKDVPLNYSKTIFVSHGSVEHEGVEINPEYTYGATSDCLFHLFPKQPFLMPNGVDPDDFNYKPKQKELELLGWCGADHLPLKQVDWAKNISLQTNIDLQIASRLSYDEVKEWYNTIDLLLITSIPKEDTESGPLPAFEAIVSGVPVIGTPVGNFRHIPGPKFKTIEEGVQIVNELKNNSKALSDLALEQYNYVMTHYSYKILAEKWKYALEFS